MVGVGLERWAQDGEMAQIGEIAPDPLVSVGVRGVAFCQLRTRELQRVCVNILVANPTLLLLRLNRFAYSVWRRT